MEFVLYTIVVISIFAAALLIEHEYENLFKRRNENLPKADLKDFVDKKQS